jgi:hypothetical protein
VYFCDDKMIDMENLKIKILNPKAKKLLEDMADLKLIAINDQTQNDFFEIVKKLRKKKAKITLQEITEEVEKVRSKRYEE